MGIRHVLLVVRCLLIEPNPDSALNEEAGKLLLEEYQEYARRAKLMTSIHATPKVSVYSCPCLYYVVFLVHMCLLFLKRVLCFLLHFDTFLNFFCYYFFLYCSVR